MAQKLDTAIGELSALFTHTQLADPAALTQAIEQCALLLANDEKQNNQLTDAGGFREIENIFEELKGTTDTNFKIEQREASSILDALLASSTSRTGKNTHAQLHIFGPLEARLLHHDRVILAGLNEGTWPRTGRNDRFLNRTMRYELGLPSPERNVGLAAHDFQQLLGKSEIILSRSLRADRAPTVASRWLQRLKAVLGEKNTGQLIDRGRQYLQFTTAIDQDLKPAHRAKRPNPAPPIEARPNALPVTAIETWIRDPYALYARRILKLRPLDPLVREADAPLRGTIYHAIMQTYIEQVDISTPQDERVALLSAIAKAQLEENALDPETTMLWQWRFDQIADTYVTWETDHHLEYSIKSIQCEIVGSHTFSDLDFTLSAIADRIELLNYGNLHIYDYKTGNAPTRVQARSLAPQLALEGVIAQEGGFKDIPADQTPSLSFIRLQRSDELKVEPIEDSKNSIASITAAATENLRQLVKAYQDPETGYISRRAPFRQADVAGDYDHLARTREWSFGEEDET